MEFDFLTPIDRRQYPSQKWDRYAADVLPLWIADMDFSAPPAVTRALAERVAHPVYGYAKPSSSLDDSLCDWSREHYGWEVPRDAIVWLPGVVPALHIASLALTSPGAGVVTTTPIYPPFLQVANKTGRLAQMAPLAEPLEPGGPWRLDFEALEAAITPETQLLLWCHPHNPTGRVWGEEELLALAELIERHDLLVISDELHADLVVDPTARHIPLASLNARLAARCVTLWAPSKTFNTAGLTFACAVITDPAVRERFTSAARGLMPDTNVLGMVATEAAWREGEPWRQQLLEVLRDNLDLLESYVARWEGVSMSRPEATYLAWLDVRQAGLGDSPQQALIDECDVALSDGADFGWPGFVRLNYGTTRRQLEQALLQMDERLATQER
ncbi:MULTISPECIES: MalY/PatB family protein [Cobetia]|uniref:cysteine-S-conjugate beta-lyase n=1 Tax=Cobetia crustatorum TaxID=553385 RepID=A0A558HDR6_9GAMM|nr:MULTISPECIES: PatB family C-S lyase [Cobetia]TVU67282.1 putative C-S lyase [Cobetia crustatorum]